MGSGQGDLGVTQVTTNEVIEAEATRNVLEKQLIRYAKRGDLTPSVLNVERLMFRNTAALTITNLDDGKPGQKVDILGDGFTTVANNTKIATASGADTLLAADSVHTFTRWDDGKWHEQSGSAGGGGGGGGGVTSFATRTGAVVPQTGDYTPAQVGAVPTSHLTDPDPHTQYALDSEKGVANGYASLDAGGKVPSAQLPAGAAVARRYWMVMILKTQTSSSNARIGELQLHATVGGSNVATGGTILFTDQYSTTGDNSAAAAFDGSSTTGWASADTSRPNGLGYQLPTAQVINEIAIICRNDSFGPQGAPIAGTVMSSADGVNWVREWDFLSPSTWTAGITRTFTRP